MSKRGSRMAAFLLAAALVAAGLPGPALAYDSTAEGPQGPISYARPTFVKRFTLAPGESVARTEVRLNGTLIRIKPDANGVLTYTPDQPLAPGEYTLKMGVQVEGSGTDFSTFSFTVLPDATAEAPAASAPAPNPESLRALEYTNAIRKDAGLSPLSYSKALGAAAGSHSRYLTVNGDSGHDERRTGTGFTGIGPGERAQYYGFGGPVAEVITYEGVAEQAVDAWMATIYHREPFLYPSYQEVGYGTAGQVDRADVMLFGGDSYAQSEPAAWPYPGQTGVPTEWSGAEHPDPKRLYPGTEGPLGYTVSLSFDAKTNALSLSEAKLTDAAGNDVPVMRFSPDNDDQLRDMVALIPYKPLAPNTTYRVRFAGSRSGSPYEKAWSFTTGPAALELFSRTENQVDGEGFAPGMSVFLDGKPVRNLSREGDSFTFDSPLGYSGRPADLLVTRPDGQEIVWPQFQADPGPADTGDSGARLLSEAEMQAKGLTAFPIPEIDRTYWTGPAGSGDVVIDSAVARVNGKMVLLPAPVQVIDGTTYVPAAFAEALLGSPAPTPPATPAAPQLSDIGSHWARAQILRLVDAGVVSGYPDGTFRPDTSLSRAAFMKMLVSARGLTLQPGATGGLDGMQTHWLAAQGYLGAAVEAGILRTDEYPGGALAPDQPISREEIAVMVVRALGDESAAQQAPEINGAPVLTIAGRTFSDPAGWTRPGYIARAVELGIVSGYQEADGTFTYRPARQATRAEAAVMIIRMIDQRR